MERPSRWEAAIGASVALLLPALGLLTAFAGLPWWLAVGVAITAVICVALTYRLDRPPTRYPEALALVALCGVLALATREVGDLLEGDGDGPYRYFATDPVAYSHIAPWSKAAVVNVLGEGDEIAVVCRTGGLKRPDQVWLRLENGSYVADAVVYQDYSSKAPPREC